MSHVRSAVLTLRCLLRLGMAIGFVFVAAASAARSDETRTPRTDLYGDPLPPGVVARLGRIRLQHANAKIAFSRDGKHLISCDMHSQVCTWDIATGKLMRQQWLPWLGDNRKAISTLALSPDGATVAGWDGSTVSICDTKTGKERGRIPSLDFGGRYLFVLAFSADGKFLAVQAPGEGPEFLTQLWDVAAVKKCRTFRNPLGISVVSLTFTRDGKRLAGIAPKSDGSGKLGGTLFDIFLWDVATGKLICKREALRKLDAYTLAFSPDGKTLVLLDKSQEQVVRLFDADTLRDKEQKAKFASPGTLNGVAFSPDGRWLTGVYATQSMHGRAEQGIILWDAASGREIRRLPGLPARSEMEIVFASDSKTLAGNDLTSSAIRLWDVASGKPLHEWPGHDEPVVGLAASPDGKILASGDADGVVRLWDVATSKQIRILEGRPLNITSCRFSSDGKRLLAAGIIASTKLHDFEEKAGFQVWDVATGMAVKRIERKGGIPLHAAALFASGTRLAAVVAGDESSAARLVIWDLATGKKMRERPYKFEVRVPTESERKHPPETVVHASFAPDGERMTVWLGDRVGIEEVATGCLLAELPRNVGLPLAFSPDGSMLVASRWKPRKGLRYQDDLLGLALLETMSGQEIRCLRLGEEGPESGMINRGVFTSDGRRLLVTDEKHLTAWDTDTGVKVYQRTQPEDLAVSFDSVGGADFSPLVMLPNARLATGMVSGEVLIWDMAAATRLLPRPTDELDNRKLDALWSDLAGDARKAHRAVYLLAASPARSLPFLNDRVRLPKVDKKRIEELLTDLDSESFTAREAAVGELTRLHHRVEPLLRRTLENKPSLEVRRRLEAILSGVKRPLPEDLRTLRAIAILERIGTPEARRILEKLAGGATSPETRAAEAALQRLKYR